MEQNNFFLITGAIAIAVMGILLSLQGGPMACTQEAMQCPDGSYVGRTGPNCEFAPCPGGEQVDYSTAVNTMRSAGYTVQLVGDVTQPYMPVKGLSITINGDTVQMFEFADRNAASSFISKISSDGSQIDGNVIPWVGSPHFFRSGSVVGVYIGDNSDTTAAMKTAFGSEIAGPDHAKVYCRPEQRGEEQCITLYKPVCGWNDPEKIQCIRYPCASTYGNSCEACSNANVLYYTEGQCPA